MPRKSRFLKSQESEIANMVEFKNPSKKCRANRRKPTSASLIESGGQYSSNSSDSEAEKTAKRKKHTPTVTASSKNQIPIDKDMAVTFATTHRNKSLVNGDEALKQSPTYDTIHDLSTASSRRYGPPRAATNVRTTTTRDYQPDVCKDFKASGYCGRANMCKFLHTREDYKQTWLLNQSRNASAQSSSGTLIGAQNKNAHGEGDLEDHGPQESKSSTCSICEKACQNAVKAPCGHVFCEGCALERYKRSQFCATCGTALDGTFRAVKSSK